MEILEIAERVLLALVRDGLVAGFEVECECDRGEWIETITRALAAKSEKEVAAE